MFKVKVLKKSAIDTSILKKRKVHFTSSDIKPFADQKLEWKNEELPDELKKLCEQVKLIFSLQDEVKGYNVRFIPPSRTVNRGKTVIIEKATGMTVCSRVVITLGSMESIGLRLENEEAEVIIPSNSGFQIPLFMVAAFDIKVDDRDGFKIKIGSKEKTVAKRPNRRYIMVIDFLTNDTTLNNVLTKSGLSENTIKAIRRNLFDKGK